MIKLLPHYIIIFLLGIDILYNRDWMLKRSIFSVLINRWYKINK